jgi:RNA recognition motif-containing protein
VTNRLYVGNLDYSTSWQDLKDHFKPCGNVVFSDVFRDERGRSKGCGIIEFETRTEALQVRLLKKTFFLFFFQLDRLFGR